MQHGLIRPGLKSRCDLPCVLKDAIIYPTPGGKTAVAGARVRIRQKCYPLPPFSPSPPRRRKSSQSSRRSSPEPARVAHCCFRPRTSSWSPARFPSCTCLRRPPVVSHESKQQARPQPGCGCTGRQQLTILLIAVADLDVSPVVRPLGTSVLLRVASAVGRRVEVGLS